MIFLVAHWTAVNIPLFAKVANKHPGAVGCLLPTMPWVAKSIAKKVADSTREQVILELGFGEGAFTRKFLHSGLLHIRARLIGIDLLREFVDQVQSTIHDPRFEAVHGDALDLTKILHQRGVTSIDGAISGIPFSRIPEHIGYSIQRQLYELLIPGGKFVTYQVWANAARIQQDVFGNVRTQRHWSNVLPPLLEGESEKQA